MEFFVEVEISSFTKREISKSLFSPPEPKAEHDDIEVTVAYILQNTQVHFTKNVIIRVFLYQPLLILKGKTTPSSFFGEQKYF